MANYPNGLDSFLQHSENVRETIAAMHANTIQDAVVAVQSTLGINPQGSSATVKDRLAALEAAIAANGGSSGYSPPVATPSVRGVLRLSGDLSGTADAPRLTQLPNLATIAYSDQPRKVVNLGNISGSVTLDLNSGNYFVGTLTGNVTINVANWQNKVLFQHVMVKLIQDATGGRTVTWPSRFSTNSTTSGLATTANSFNLYEFASMDIGASVQLWAQPTFSVPVQADKFDAAVLGLSSLRYYWPLEETTGTTVADASGSGNASTYSGTFSLASVLTVPTSAKNSPSWASTGSTYIAKDSVRFATATGSAWSMGFTIQAGDPGISAREVIYSETLSSDSTTGQGFYIESGTTTITSNKTGLVLRLTNASGSDVFNKTLSKVYFDGIAHFVIINFDGTNAWKVYTDGILTDTFTQTVSAVTVDRATWGARRRTTTDRYFTGAMGRLWTRNAQTTQAEATLLASQWTNATGGGGSDPDPGGGNVTFDKNGVKLGIPTVTVNNSSINVSAVIQRNKSVEFAYLQIAVRPPAGSGGTAFSTAYSPGAQSGSGSTTITGTGTCDASGTWTAFATYSLVANPVQADWTDGTPVSFTIGTVAPPDPGTGGGTEPPTATGKMALGASSPYAANGSLGAWIGKQIDIGGTWNDGAPDGQIGQWTVQPGNEWGSWTGYIDLAVGAIWPSNGETWAAAANGSYDARWRQCLTNIKSAYNGRDTSKIFLRFAAEFNIPDMPWCVHGADAGNFKTAWRRFRALQKEILPLAKLVWCPNDGTNGGIGLNLMDAYPGAGYVDVYAFDTYNNWDYNPYTSQSTFNDYLNRTDSTGPVGPEAHRANAQALGLPVGIGEYSSCGDPGGQAGGGDSPGYFNKLFDWFFQHEGDPANPQPGKMIYAVQFNLWDYYMLYPTTMQPNAAAAWKARMLSRT